MLPFTRHGFWEIIIGTIILLAVGWGLGWLWWPLSFLALPVIVWLWAFFRDPNRPLPTDPNTMVSPADGVVSDIGQIEHDENLGGPCIRIGIFLSVFNVHVNRSPCDGRVVEVKYKTGKFINAMRHNDASSQNESNTIVLAEPNGERRVAVIRQIVGLIARRIICDLKPGDSTHRGDRFGMIKFGSRTELYIPLWLNPDVKVAVGQKVRGTADVIATIKPT